MGWICRIPDWTYKSVAIPACDCISSVADSSNTKRTSDNSTIENQMAKKECPSCAMEIDADAKVCPICSYEFTEGHSSGSRWLAILLITAFLLSAFYYLIF